MKQSLEEFKSDIIKRSGKGRKKAKISNSFGVRDVFKSLRKKHWYNIGRPLKEKEFYHIIRNINNLLAEELSKGNTVKFPARMGELELRKHEVGASLKDGKLKISYPIDWKKTVELWYDDKEAYDNRILLRYNTDQVYRIKYSIFSARYENKCFYQFALNRKIKVKLKDNINKGKTDTLWLKK